jgi:hypothetical protein
MISGQSAWTFIAAWSIFLLVLVGLAKTPWGRPAVYYMLWLLIAFLLVSQAQTITNMFVAAGISSGLGGGGGKGPTGGTSGQPPKYQTSQQSMTVLT